MCFINRLIQLHYILAYLMSAHLQLEVFCGQETKFSEVVFISLIRTYDNGKHCLTTSLLSWAQPNSHIYLYVHVLDAHCINIHNITYGGFHSIRSPKRHWRLEVSIQKYVPFRISNQQFAFSRQKLIFRIFPLFQFLRRKELFPPLDPVIYCLNINDIL